jgi:hypothetical protein
VGGIGGDAGGIGGDAGVGGDADGGGLLAGPPLGAMPMTPQTPGGGRIGPAPQARPGMPGMPVAPAAKKKDEDKEHRSPSYLVNLDNGNRLIGPLGKASPAVIGVWDDEPDTESQDDSPA